MMFQLIRFTHYLPSYRVYNLLFSFLLVFCFFAPLQSAIDVKAKKEKKAKAARQTSNPGQVGSWTNGFSSKPAVHMSVLPNGKVLSWTYWDENSTNLNQTFAMLWDPFCIPSQDPPNCSALTYPHNNNVNLFCSGHSLLPDGRLLVTSGTLNRTYFDGTNTAAIFDYQTEQWSAGPVMNNGRWYPTNVQLGNGETVTVGGSYCQYRDLNGICIIDERRHPLGFNHVPQAFRTISGVDSWRTLSNISLTPGTIFYPWLLLASDGRVFNAGPAQATYFLDASGNGSWSNFVSNNYGGRLNGSAVMYNVDKVLILGGNPDAPTNSAEVIDLSAPNPPGPSWRVLSNSMQYARNHPNTTILADGKVLVTGGTKGTGANNTCVNNFVLAAELWNPGTETFTTMASEQYARLYHSTAALLPDGRVLVGGTSAYPANGLINYDADIPCPNGVSDQNQTEIFTPPYLYNSDGTLAVRPSITSAPSNLSYGQQFTVTVSSGSSSISKVTLVRLSSVTHSFNQNQRFNNLAFSKPPFGLSVMMPSNPNACPPGHYMLFVINNAGVPSEAKIVRVS